MSPYYALELVSGIERGVELDNILRLTGVSGIVNGMDVNEWNPATDKYIAANYDAETVSSSDLETFLCQSFIAIKPHENKKI